MDTASMLVASRVYKPAESRTKARDKALSYIEPVLVPPGNDPVA